MISNIYFKLGNIYFAENSLPLFPGVVKPVLLWMKQAEEGDLTKLTSGRLSFRLAHTAELWVRPGLCGPIPNTALLATALSPGARTVPLEPPNPQALHRHTAIFFLGRSS